MDMNIFSSKYDERQDFLKSNILEYREGKVCFTSGVGVSKIFNLSEPELDVLDSLYQKYSCTYAIKKMCFSIDDVFGEQEY
jgi:hypothetical protein